MNQRDFVYKAIYTGSLKKGATERASHQAAVTGSEDYRKGRFKKPLELIERKIMEAKKQK